MKLCRKYSTEKEVILCGKCKSPINIKKAERRFYKKYKKEPTFFYVGLCACGDLIWN